jgi:hypothetical protein
MGFLVLLAAIVIARIVWRLMSRRSVPRFEGAWRSESYKRKIAASASDYKTRSEFAAMRGFI